MVLEVPFNPENSVILCLGENLSLINMIVKRSNCFKIAHPAHNLPRAKYTWLVCLLFESRFYEANCFLFLGEPGFYDDYERVPAEIILKHPHKIKIMFLYHYFLF